MSDKNELKINAAYGHAAAEAVKQGAAEEGLARANFPGYGDKALPLLNPIQQMPSAS